MEARQILADAASTVAGVTVLPRLKQSAMKPGQGGVRLDGVEYPNPFGGICTWQVVVYLPAVTEDAETWIDTHLDDLVAALSPHLIVRTAQPIRLVLEAGAVPALVITGNREKE